jgi:hypothetical protein
MADNQSLNSFEHMQRTLILSLQSQIHGAMIAYAPVEPNFVSDPSKLL